MTDTPSAGTVSTAEGPMDKLHALLHPTADALLPRIEEALRRFKNRDCSMRIPVHESDMDIVLRASVNVIDAAQARITVLTEALRTEIENCVRLTNYHSPMHWDGCGEAHPMCAAIIRMKAALAEGGGS